MKNKKEASTIEKIIAPVQYKFYEEKSESGEDEMILEAYVSIFGNVDLGGDIIQMGAFAESLLRKFPKGVWSHNWDQPIAKTLEAREDEKGLFIKARFTKGVQKAEEAYLLIKDEVIDEFSIGFRCLDYEYNEAGNRIIKKARLYEWSPVLAGMNPDTEVVSIKADEEEAKEVASDYKIDLEAKTITITLESGEVKTYSMNNELLHKSEALQPKVGPDTREGKATRAQNEQILRIRQATKRAKLANDYVLRIVSNLSK